jgi:hypothetical protein
MTKREMQKQIADLTERLVKLENMHAKIEEVDNFPWGFTPMAIKERTYCHKIGSYDNRDLTAREVQSVVCNPHPQTRERTASTKSINNITFSELAKFVIDGTPINREYSKPTTYKSIYTPEATTKSVKTDLGNITITEGID